MQPKQKNRLPVLKFALLNGASGCFGVACQTVGLLWHVNLREQRVRTGQATKQAVVQLYKTGGLIRFYQGFFTAFRSASMARFGDNFFAAFITKKIDRNKYLKNSSLLIKSAFVWLFASTWRLAILPIDALDHFNKGLARKANQDPYSHFRKTLKRIYLKRSRPEIISLYFWFSFHMLCDEISHPLAFRDNLPVLVARNAAVGFGSMALFDFILESWRKIQKVQGQCSNQNVLLGQCNSRTLLKGLHGAMFCTFSNLFKLKASQAVRM